MEFYKHQQVHSSGRMITGLQKCLQGRILPRQIAKQARNASWSNYILNTCLEMLLWASHSQALNRKKTRCENSWHFLHSPFPLLHKHLRTLNAVPTKEKITKNKVHISLKFSSNISCCHLIRMAKALSLRWSPWLLFKRTEKQSKNTSITPLDLDYVLFGGILPMLTI